MFLPLNPVEYAELLGSLLEKHPGINVRLINTGWIGGSYGIGKRISLSHTRAMINAALNGQLNEEDYKPHAHFGVQIPLAMPGVPDEILDPRNAWADKEAYDEAANGLAQLFIKNFEQYIEKAGPETRAGAAIIVGTIVNN